MAEDKASWTGRGRYRNFLRHCKQFKFPAARRRKNKMPKVGERSPFIDVTPCSGNELNSVSLIFSEYSPKTVMTILGVKSETVSNRLTILTFQEVSSGKCASITK